MRQSVGKALDMILTELSTDIANSVIQSVCRTSHVSSPFFQPDVSMSIHLTSVVRYVRKMCPLEFLEDLVTARACFDHVTPHFISRHRLSIHSLCG